MCTQNLIICPLWGSLRLLGPTHKDPSQRDPSAVQPSGVMYNIILSPYSSPHNLLLNKALPLSVPEVLQVGGVWEHRGGATIRDIWS